ncbi:MAG: phosphoadenosine phosphosulfate reductase domain-containing protein [Rhodospirillales bacterium]
MLINGFDAWITGRKQYQNIDRAQLLIFELDDGHIKVNPLMGWNKAQIGT